MNRAALRHGGLVGALAALAGGAVALQNDGMRDAYVRRLGRRGAAARAAEAAGIGARDKTIQTCVGVVEIKMQEHAGAGGTREGAPKILLYGPEGAGRELVVQQLVAAADAPAGDWNLLDLRRSERRGLWNGWDAAADARWLLFDLCYLLLAPSGALQSLMTTSDLTGSGPWVVEGAARGHARDVVAALRENAAIPLVASADVATVEEFEAFACSWTRKESSGGSAAAETCALRVGDPAEESWKESRLQALAEAADVAAPPLADVERDVGWRLFDLDQVFTSMRDHGRNWEQAVDELTESLKSDLWEHYFKPGALDAQIAVWMWTVMEGLCGLAPVLTGLNNADGAIPVAALPQLLYVFDDESALQPVHRQFCWDAREGPPPALAVRRSVKAAFQRLARDQHAAHAMRQTTDHVHTLQDLHFLRNDMLAHLARSEQYETLARQLAALDDDAPGVLAARIDLDAERQHLDTSRRNLLRRLRAVQ